MPAPQSYKNHARWDPLFHFVLAPIFLLNIFATTYWHFHHHMHTHYHSGLWLILVSIALFALVLKIRNYALANQDRIIRLEEKHRLASLASPSELIELDSLTMGQYIALRFASNPELPALARRAIRENLTPKQIKEAIISWRPDNHRI